MVLLENSLVTFLTDLPRWILNSIGPIAAANAVTLALAVAILILKLRYDRHIPPRGPQPLNDKMKP